MICPVCEAEMGFTKWGIWVCPACQYDSKETDDPKELEF